MKYHPQTYVLSTCRPPAALYGCIKRIVAILIFACISGSSFAQGHPATDDEFVGPFPSWINVKTQFGAVGDGIADETATLQAAINAVGNSNSTAIVVYLPAGTYRITGTLTATTKINISIIGADPATTKIVWAGASSGTMFRLNGVAYSRFNRITWDGASSAAVAVDQSWDPSNPYFDTGNEYADDEFKNVGIGIRGGNLGSGFAETAIMRCKFNHNTTAGISLGNFNALDAWIWFCIFDNCTVGITNNTTSSSAGNFKVYNSIFRNSTNSDIIIGNTGEFAFRDNTSSNSQTFLKATLKPYPCHITLQSNTIIDPISSKVIDIQNQGPVMLIDNIIRSRSGATAPVVFQASYPNNDFFSMGNTFTVGNPIQSGGRNIIYDNAVVTAASLSRLAEPTLPGTQPNLNRTIFEVPAGADATTIQSIINQAALLSGTRPVVHFPFGNYNIQSSLSIPPGADMQITGDGHGDIYRTSLTWSGNSTGPIINIAGPSKVTLRDIFLNGNNLVTNIVMSNVDQVNSRIFMHELEGNYNANGVLVNGLENCLVLAYNSRISGCTGKAFNIIGGPLAASGNPQLGRTVFYGGVGWENNLTHEVTNGGNFLIRDVWYESNHNGPYLNLPGKATVTLDCSSIASPRGTVLPQISLSNFSGKVALVNSWIQDRVAISGNGVETKVLGLGTVFSDNTAPVGPATNSYFDNIASPAGDIRSFNSRSYNDPNTVSPRYGSFQVNNTGTIDSAFIAALLQQLRNEHVRVLTSLPNGVSDVRFYRVWLYQGTTGLDIEGNAVPVIDNFFRSAASGNWNSVSTWESSTDNNTWQAATYTPNINSNTITIRSGHTVTVTSDITIDQTVVNAGGTMVVTGCTVTVMNNGLTLKSDATGSARIGNSSGTVTGNVKVERYIPANTSRAWRLLSLPTVSTQTINAAWQNGQAPGVTGNTGVGTMITANNGGSSFDFQTTGNSMLTYSAATNAWLGIANTTSNIASDNGWMLFVRGDRLATPLNSVKTATTLSTTGTLKQGNYPAIPISVSGNQFGAIGNPYASQIDFRNVIKSIGIDNTFYVWDPKLTGAYGVGGYQTLTYNGSNYIITPGGGSYGTSGSVMNTIESGQAFFVHASSAGTIGFTENMKTTGSSNVFRLVSTPSQSLITNLYSTGSAGDELVDGTMHLFDDSYSPAIDAMDAFKLANFGINLGISSGQKILSVEKRNPVQQGDILEFSLNNIQQQGYKFEFIANGICGPQLLPFLVDKFQHTETRLSPDGTTVVSFSVTLDTASSSSDRFSIFFKKPSINLEPAITVYPNPVQNGALKLQWNNLPSGSYSIQLINGIGQIVLNKQVDHILGNSSETISVNNLHGNYILQVIKPDNLIQAIKIIILQ